MLKLEYPPTKHLAQLVADEVRQRREEGCDVDDLTEALRTAGHNRDRLWELYDALAQRTPTADFPYAEPDDLDALRAARPDNRPTLEPLVYDNMLRERLHGGWLGRCAGMVLGKPFESDPFITKPQATLDYLKAASAFPLDDYAPHDEQALAAIGAEKLPFPDSHRGRVRFVESDDDIRYTLMGLDLLEQHGLAVDTADVARWWTHRLPSAYLFTAEEAALRNLFLLHGHFEPHQLSAEQLKATATWLNPYREWIGAQIRADGWALACPGRPTLAAELAWRDARLSHVKNGIYGEMYCAAMIAAAPVCDAPYQIVAAGLAEIPARCRLTEAIQAVIGYCEHADGDVESAVKWLWDTFGHYHWVHTINNAAVVTLALLLGDGDFTRTIGLAVMAGWDSDCNGATAGCVAGALLGANRLPKHWTKPLNNTVMSELPGFHPIAIDALAQRHFDLAKRFAAEQD